MTQLLNKKFVFYLLIIVVIFSLDRISKLYVINIAETYGNVDIFCLGSLQCEAPDLKMIFIIKILYVLLWSIIIQLLCNAGQEIRAWLFVLYPLLLYFIMIADLMV